MEELNSVFCELNVLQRSSPAEPSDLQVSSRIVWHSPRTLRSRASNQSQREEYFKLTSSKTVEVLYFLCRIRLSIKKQVVLHFKIATHCHQIPK